MLSRLYYKSTGQTNMQVEISDIVKPGVKNATFHSPEAPVSFLTSIVDDKYTLAPEYEVVTVGSKSHPRF